MSVVAAIMLMALAITNELFTRKLIGQSAISSNSAITQAEAAHRNARVIISMGMLPQIVCRWHARNAEALSAHTTAGNRATAITATSKVIRQALQILVLGAGAWLVLKNELTPGAMIATSILMARALAPVESAIGSWRSAIGARDAYCRVKEMLSTQGPEAEAVSLPRPKGRLSAERITYRHPGQKESTLRTINFELGAGETLAILGATAAGKSTLANILVGNIVPQIGQARLDGADLAHISTDDRNRYVGFLPQDVELFSGTVRENIARLTDASDEEVVAAAQRAGAHEVILGLPQGYDTEIGDSGTALSGGQRQQVGLARALFGDPRFVVLDEPNANLDNQGEQKLIATFEALKSDQVTLVFITHRPNILRTADKILILKDGAIAQFGAREEVLQKAMRPEPAIASAAG
jgi:PrtD family type I secretion system ABC transporter